MLSVKRLADLTTSILCIVFLSLPVGAEQLRGREYYDSGVFAYEDGDWEEAEKKMKTALESEPDNPFYNHFMGKIFLKAEKYHEAEKYLGIAWELNQDISGLKYDIALLNSKKSDYRKAADLFMEIAGENPSDALAHYHAGMNLYNQELFGKALKYLLKAARLSSAIKDNAYYYSGICYWKTGEFEKAAKKFEYVRDNANSEKFRANAQSMLQSTEKPLESKKPYSLYLKIGYQYDDNVRLESLDSDVSADDSDYVVEGYFSGKYNVIDRKDLKTGIEYSHYQTWHKELGEYDLTGSIIDINAKYNLHPFTFGFSYLPSYYWVDSETYLRQHRFRPEVMWKADENLTVRFSYSYYTNNYPRDDARDGHANDVFLDLYYTLSDKKGYLFGGIGYEDISASSDNCYGQFTANFGILLNLPHDMSLSLMGKYYNRDYDNTDTLYRVKRQDAKWLGAISLSRKLYYDWLSVLGEFDYMTTDSNINTYEYDRKVVILSLVVSN
ncbi:MAG: DUF560 domain-containing protein [Desulfobacteraceae bacterium]|nr:DUF560 domain-containing protein [Desulfobacteraceae bacterium]